MRYFEICLTYFKIGQTYFFLLPAVFLFFLFQLCQLYTKRLFDDLFIFKKRFFFWCYSVFPSFYSTGKVTKNELAAGLPLRF